ncbi:MULTISPECIES: hypothetical protein [unclassified Leucobacter]|uniref:hypothetical protein n=1 Tax=unclassified Leucobacter TaxID=2621730 RepID=UPI00165E3132|nr:MULTISPECIES: hypothetical protein [unclassified Leucobacter]MBC9928399.1 hypothetical protein [Leucobacter sp. cx-169]
MAIARTVRPLVLIYGTVETSRELRKKPENGGDIYATEFTVKQPGGALLSYSIYANSSAPHPKIGSFVAAECSIEESRNFGASLSYERPGENALDLIASTLTAAK